jgi:hypothetical protein
LDTLTEVSQLDKNLVLNRRKSAVVGPQPTCFGLAAEPVNLGDEPDRTYTVGVE